jgi:hypothetical protein
MNMRRFVHILQWLCAAWCVLSSSAHAASVRVLLVTGRGVSDDTQAAIESAVSADGELLDPREYERLARAAGELPSSDAALERIAPRVQAQLIIVVQKTGGKLALVYRDGATGEVLRKQSLPERHRGAAAARFQARLAESVQKMLASLAAHSGSAAAPARRAPVEEREPEPPPEAAGPEPSAEPVDGAQASSDQLEAEAPVESTADSQSTGFVFELSAGLGGAMRQSTLPTRLGLHQFDSGLYAGVSFGMRVVAPLGEQGLLRASADYRTSLGLQGRETQRQTEMSTPLRSHAVGFGIAPGYRFGSQDGVSLLLHLGWYFRGLRPIAQLALPEVSWHAAVVRPELLIPIADGAVTLRLAPELLVIAGLYTTLPDQSGIARSGLGFGGELSIDVRLGAPLGLRIEYRESHATFSTAWERSLSDVERFASVRLLLLY